MNSQKAEPALWSGEIPIVWDWNFHDLKYVMGSATTYRDSTDVVMELRMTEEQASLIQDLLTGKQVLALSWFVREKL